ncbi:biphenyl 2,3-dioxygenase [bacterium]|nr:biphenyl 2,3-dioxygenase [bacterium]
MQPGPVVAQARVHRLLRALAVPARGRFRLRLTMPAGGGAGASTAALMALALAAGAVDREAIIAEVLAQEGASDPLLFASPERVLWASRRGAVLACLPALPKFEVLGGFLGPGQRTDPFDHDFPDISDLLADWPGADLAVMARLASQSARRTLALRGPAGDPTEGLARRLGALGFTIAHTGAARGLIFAPGLVPQAAAADLRAAGFSRITRFRCGG